MAEVDEMPTFGAELKVSYFLFLVVSFDPVEIPSTPTHAPFTNITLPHCQHKTIQHDHDIDGLLRMASNQQMRGSAMVLLG